MKSKNNVSIVVLEVLLIGLMMLLVACQNTSSIHKILFDSGQGTGAYDNMTYPEYESLVTITPQESITIKSINPQINYCSGSCGYIVMVHNQDGQVLAYQTGLIDIKDQSNPLFPERYLNSPLQLIAQTEYLIYIKVWATESVGIYTTGDRTNGVLGDGIYKVIYAHSNLVFPINGMPPNDNLDRGSVAFQFVY